MNAIQLHEGIKETNLSYMLLSRQMIHEDKAAAIFCLEVDALIKSYRLYLEQISVSGDEPVPSITALPPDTQH